jgi:hypothetical protein
MKKPGESLYPRVILVSCLAVIALASMPFLSRARTVSTSVNIVNNSGRGILNVYSSHINADDWGSNLLGEATIAAGQSYNLTNVTCDQQQVKIIAEDQDGCFLTTVVNCGEAMTWTITSNTARDCGQ